MMGLVAAGTLAVASASTVAAVAWPSGGAEASSANLTAFTQSQATLAAQQSRYEVALRAEQVAAAKAAQAAKAVAADRAAQAAAKSKEAAVKAAKAAAAKTAAAKTAAAKTAAQAAAKVQASGTPQQIAAAMLGQFGWSGGQMSCLQPLWQQESRWLVTAQNPGSGAYGIPQALPGSKMASAGPDWQTSAATQIKWGLGYIKQVYGSPCAAEAHEQADGWY